jgi:tetratricopeptide (TPR) repeat protein
MSLLIKALEQAAKDRDSAKSAATPAASAARPAIEPTLEPAPPPKDTSTTEALPPRATASANNAAPAPRNAAPLSLDAPAAQRRTPSSAAALANIDAEQQRARAAAVVRASTQSGEMFARWRGNPVIMFGAVAALFGIGFGIYVYLQIARPGLFVHQAATNPQQGTAQPVAGTATSQPNPATPDARPADTAAMSNGSPVMINAAPPAASSRPVAPSSVGTVGAAQLYTPSPGRIASASVIGNASARDLQDERETASRRDTLGPRVRTEGVKAAAPALEIANRRDSIAVSPSTSQPTVNPALSQAYRALQSGNIEEARALYSRLSQSEPLNVDALLGLAYIAAQENHSDDAMKLYMRILQINPRHAAAQGALIGLVGRADPVASETRLKLLISREPSAFLHFILGNLYADQSLWAQAQQAYFQAHHLEPDNPDYAYNLAVGLDHLRQDKLALRFYQRAEQSAVSLGRANFSLTHARERIGILSSQPE